MDSNNSDETWFHKFERFASIGANIVVILGIFFALYQIIQSNDAEKRRIAIESIGTTRTTEFVKALARLKTTYNLKNIENQKIFIDDLNYLISIYDNIAMLYINDIADKAIIKEAIASNINDIYNILNLLEKYPHEYRKNIDILYREFNLTNN